MKVIQQFYGVKVGGFVDIFEFQVSLEREATIKAILQEFGGSTFGRAFDGAYILVSSRWREIVFYLHPDLVRFEDRHRFPVSVRLLPSGFRRKMEKVAQSLKG